ncbi:hypothetical protein [Fodinicola feengrottensis]|nr:hypothetical protein [Fodinicola feengrottensis]
MGKRIITAIAAASIAAVLISGCETDNALHPAAPGPVIDGHPTCGYVVSRDECKDSGVPPQYWYQLPANAPTGYRDTNTDLISQLFLWHLIYQQLWYSQPVYRDTYVPSAYRSTYDQKYSSPFNSRYSSLITLRQARARFVDKTNKPVPASQLNTRRVNGCAAYQQLDTRGGGSGGGTGGSGHGTSGSTGRGGSGTTGKTSGKTNTKTGTNPRSYC